jgi:alanine racemase
VEVPQGTRIATVGIGYADGLHRILSNTQLGGYIQGHFAPLLGRVSMDLVMLDVTHLPADVIVPGARVEFLGKHQLVDTVAALAQTIGYEVLTSISPRVTRRYNT